MKTTVKFTLSFAALSALLIFSGCASAEKPNYQGKKGATPTIDDYYPKRTK